MSLPQSIVAQEAPRAVNAIRNGAALGMAVSLSIATGAIIIPIAADAAMCVASNPAAQQSVIDFATSLMIPGAPESSTFGFLGGVAGYYAGPEESLR